MKTVMLKKEEIKRSCYLVDAKDKVLGRLATQVAAILSGKCKTAFTPYVDCGDTVIVINADKIKITGKKMQQKTYQRYSGYQGGLKVETLETLMASEPQEVIRQAIKGMLPKNKLQKDMMSRLKVYAGDKHPHQAQQPKAIDIKA